MDGGSKGCIHQEIWLIIHFFKQARPLSDEATQQLWQAMVATPCQGSPVPAVKESITPRIIHQHKVLQLVLLRFLTSVFLNHWRINFWNWSWWYVCQTWGWKPLHIGKNDKFLSNVIHFEIIYIVIHLYDANWTSNRWSHTAVVAGRVVTLCQSPTEPAVWELTTPRIIYQYRVP